jgi:hypothetical protein
MPGRSALFCAVLGALASLGGPCLGPPAALAASSPATNEAPAGEVTIYVTSGPIHSDIIIPRSAFANASPLMRDVVDNAKGGPWIIFGWGPYWFGRETRGGPYHGQPILGINAIYTTFIPQLHSRLRVAALDEPGPAPLETSTAMVAVRITPEGLQRSIQRIAATIETTRDGAPVLGEQGGEAPGVTMYRSREVYHLTHECNHWVAEVLHAGGVPDRAVLDLLPQSLDADLELSGATPVSREIVGRMVEAGSAPDPSKAEDPVAR